MPEPDRPRQGRTTLIVANLTAFALLVAAGLVHGRLTDRWGTSTELVDATARLQRVPESIGDWQSRDLPLEKRQIDRAGIQGYVSRSYWNAKDGRQLSILLVCGRPGKIAVHTPDVCYRGAGYEPEHEPVVEVPGTVGGQPARFLKARFGKDTAAGPRVLDIAWSWNARGSWEIPANPRVAFASRAYLYKIYLISSHDGLSEPSTIGSVDHHQPAIAILEAIDRALFDREAPAVGLPASRREPRAHDDSGTPAL
jgi:hypothetical protein